MRINEMSIYKIYFMNFILLFVFRLNNNNDDFTNQNRTKYYLRTKLISLTNYHLILCDISCDF